MEKDITVKHLDWLEGERYSPRRIVSACNKFMNAEGEVRLVPCVRHYSKETSHIVKYLRSSGFKEVEQGFIDQFSDFFSREDALVIALKNNQVVVKHDPEYQLFSEDLY